MPTLISAKKENVDLQLEAAYRERLQNVYKAVTRRLVSRLSFPVNDLLPVR